MNSPKRSAYSLKYFRGPKTVWDQVERPLISIYGVNQDTMRDTEKHSDTHKDTHTYSHTHTHTQTHTHTHLTHTDRPTHANTVPHTSWAQCLLVTKSLLTSKYCWCQQVPVVPVYFSPFSARFRAKLSPFSSRFGMKKGVFCAQRMSAKSVVFRDDNSLSRPVPVSASF